jgi:hypothetical protein
LYGKDTGVDVGNGTAVDYRFLTAFVGFQLHLAPDNFLNVMPHMKHIASVKQMLHLSYSSFSVPKLPPFLRFAYLRMISKFNHFVKLL